MKEESNKTMLVPVNNNSNSLTGFNQNKESYSSFKQNTLASKAVESSYSKGRLYECSENPLLFLSSSIFHQIDVLQNSYDIGSLDDVRNSLITKMDDFIKTAIEKGIDNVQVMLTRYMLCTFSDEMISSTYWGKDNNWANSSLLGHFYNETYGGERFFQVLDKILRSPAKYIDILEIMYVCLSLGFEGKYRIQNRGKMELDKIREGLYKQIKMMDIRETKKFYVPQKTSLEKNNLVYEASYKILAVSIIVLLGLVYTILTLSLIKEEDETITILKNQYAQHSNIALSATKDSVDGQSSSEQPSLMTNKSLMTEESEKLVKKAYDE